MHKNNISEVIWAAKWPSHFAPPSDQPFKTVHTTHCPSIHSAGARI